MRRCHLTMVALPCWFADHFDRLLAETGHTGETMYLSFANFSAEKADEIWHQYKDYFDSFDAILVSHIASWCRPFLQRGWTKPLFVWLFFRFDHDVPDRQEYYDLLRRGSQQPNVKFFAATEYDREYAKSKLGEFPLDIVTPFLHVDNGPKSEIPCGPDKFYLVGKHNESLVSDRLQSLGVPFYRQDWHSRVPDLRNVRGVIHLPYVYATRSLIENIALENVYFLPTPNLLNEFRRYVPGYFWDGGMPSDVLCK